MGEWRDLTWGKVSDLEYGKSLRNYQETNGKVPVYGTNGQIGFTDECLCPFPSVIIGRKGAYRGVHYSPVPFFVIDTAFYLKPKQNNIINLKFAYYKLLTQNINRLDSGSAIPSTSREDFYQLDLLLPSLQEQKQIAAVLSCLDDKIDNLRRQNETLEKIAQLLFKRWFIDFEFPNDDGKPYKSSGGEMVASELGEIPQGWRIGEIEDMFNFLEGPGIRNWQYTVSGTRFINIRLIQNGDIEVEKSNFISNEEANDKYAHFHLQENDLVVSTSGTLGRCAIVRKEHLPLLLNTSVIRFRPKHQNNYPFMYQLFKSNYFLHHLKTLASGSVQLNFGPMHLRQINLLIPDRTTLNQFSESTQSIYQKYLLNFKQVQTLTKTRDLLLPKLMSGQIRIEEGEEE